MGDFRVTIEASGAHGCGRDKKDGEEVYGCGRMDCPDCLTACYVMDMLRAGVNIKSAVLVHWPGEAGEVTDKFETSPLIFRRARRKREGSFP